MKSQVAKWRSFFFLLLALSLAFVMGYFCIRTGSADANTITNKDIEAMKRQQERQQNKQQNKNNPPQKGHPTVPGVSGVPTVPGPGGASTTIGGAVLVKKHLPFVQWEESYREYFREHYNDTNLDLKPRLIVLHYSGTQDFSQLWWTFVNGGVYEGKKGNLSVHYVVDKDGTIYELIPPNRRARGTYGVNHAAITINIIGRNENEILANAKQQRVSFSLVRWLMQQYRIPKEKVLAHTEVALGKELVPEYTDFVDKQFPDRYPPNSRVRGPGRTYMFKLRYFLVEPQ